MKLRSAGVDGATTLRGAEMTRAKPSRWPWMVIAVLFGVIAVLLKLGSVADADPKGTYQRLEVASPSADVTYQQAGTATETVAVTGYSQVSGNTGALPVPVSAKGSEGTSGGISGWFSKWFGDDSESSSAPEALQAGALQSGGGVRTTSTVVPGVISTAIPVAPVASAVGTSSTHTPSNDQLMQPGDDSAFLNDGEPGEEAGGGSQY